MTLDEYIATLQELAAAGHGGLRVVKEYDSSYDDLDREPDDDQILTVGHMSENGHYFVEPGDEDYLDDPPAEQERVVCIRQ